MYNAVHCRKPKSMLLFRWYQQECAKETCRVNCRRYILFYLAALAVVTHCGCSRMEIRGNTDAQLEDRPYAETSSDENSEAPYDVIFDLTDIGDTASTETPADSITEDAFLDTSTDTPSSECNIIEQSGCPEGMWCSWSFDEGTCEYYENCFARTPGTIAAGDECHSWEAEPRCEPGTECVRENDGSPTERCYEWCSTDEDCTVPYTECGRVWGGIIVVGPCAGIDVIYPYQLCMSP